MLKLKRVYQRAERTDGRRILVDRLWPRGLRKKEAKVDQWMKEIAPSAELRRWFGHDAAKWPEFQRRYKRELRERADLVRHIAKFASRGRVTLVYAARDAIHNHATVLAGVVGARIKTIHR